VLTSSGFRAESWGDAAVAQGGGRRETVTTGKRTEYEDQQQQQQQQQTVGFLRGTHRTRTFSESGGDQVAQWDAILKRQRADDEGNWTVIFLFFFLFFSFYLLLNLFFCFFVFGLLLSFVFALPVPDYIWLSCRSLFLSVHM